MSAGFSAGEINVILRAKDEMSQVFQSAAGEAEGFGGKVKGMLGGLMGSMAGGLGTLGLASIGFDKLKETIGGFVEAASRGQLVDAQTAAALQSTGAAAGMTSDAIANLATSLSKTTTFSKDTTQSAENLLLTFTSIGKDVFPQATKTVLDMSQALGQDTKSSAIQLGKALNDPIQGMSALRRVGVSFTQEQKDQITQMQKSGNLMGAQKIILAELSKEFGGSAEAAGKTFGGQLQILHNQMELVKEHIGTALMPALLFLMQGFVRLSGVANDLITGGLAILGDWFDAIADRLSGPVTGAFDAVSGAVDRFADRLRGPLDVAMQFLRGALAFIQTDFGSIQNTLATGAMDHALEHFFSRETSEQILQRIFQIRYELERFVSFARGALTTALTIAHDSWTTFKEALAGNWTNSDRILMVHRIIGELGLTIRNLVSDVSDMASSFRSQSGALSSAVIPAWHLLGNALDLVRSHFNDIMSVVRPIMTILGGPFHAVLWGMLEGFGEHGLAGILPGAIKGLEHFGQAFLSLGHIILDGIGRINWTVLGQSIVSGIGNALSALANIASSVNWSDIASGMLQALSGAFDTVSGIAWDAATTILGWVSTKWDTLALPVLHGVLAAFDSVTGITWDAAKTVTGWVQNVKWDALAQPILTNFVTAFDTVTGITWDAARTMLGWIGNVQWRDFAQTLLTSLRDALANATGITWDAAVTVAKWVTGNWSGLASTVLHGIRNGFDGVKDVTWDAAGTVAGWVGTVKWDKLASSILHGIRDAFDTVTGITWDETKTIGSWLAGVKWGPLATTILGDIASAFTTVAGITWDAAATVVKWISKQDWSGIASFILTHVRDGLTAAKNVVWDAAAWLLNAIQNVKWGAVASFIADHVGAELGKLSDIGKAVAETIINFDYTDAGKTVASKVADGVKQAQPTGQQDSKSFWEKFIPDPGPYLSPLASDIGKNVSDIVKNITTITDSLSGLTPSSGDWANALGGVTLAIVALSQGATVGAGVIVDSFTKAGSILTSMPADSISGLGTLTGWLGDTFGPAWTTASGAVTTASDSITTTATNIASGVSTAIKGIPDDVSRIFGDAAADAAKILGGARDEITRLGGEISGGLGSGITGNITAVATAISGVVSSIFTPFANAATWLLGVGGDIVAGLEKGINDAAGGVADAVKAITDKIPKWLQDQLGINSPSKVTADIAIGIPEGVVVGIQSGVPLVGEAIGNLATQISGWVDSYMVPTQQKAASHAQEIAQAIATNLTSKTPDIQRALAAITDDVAVELDKLRDDLSNKINLAQIAGNADDVTKFQAQLDSITAILGQWATQVGYTATDVKQRIADALNAKSVSDEVTKTWSDLLTNLDGIISGQYQQGLMAQLSQLNRELMVAVAGGASAAIIDTLNADIATIQERLAEADKAYAAAVASGAVANARAAQNAVSAAQKIQQAHDTAVKSMVDFTKAMASGAQGASSSILNILSTYNSAKQQLDLAKLLGLSGDALKQIQDGFDQAQIQYNTAIGTFKVMLEHGVVDADTLKELVKQGGDAFAAFYDSMFGPGAIEKVEAGWVTLVPIDKIKGLFHDLKNVSSTSLGDLVAAVAGGSVKIGDAFKLLSNVTGQTTAEMAGQLLSLKNDTWQKYQEALLTGNADAAKSFLTQYDSIMAIIAAFAAANHETTQQVIADWQNMLKQAQAAAAQAHALSSSSGGGGGGGGRGYSGSIASLIAHIQQQANGSYQVMNNIPHFADGGIVYRPTVALIGEKGPEMIVPLYSRGGGSSGSGGRNTVPTQQAPFGGISPEQFADRFIARVAPALERAGENGVKRAMSGAL